jgi:hypothetical protein
MMRRLLKKLFFVTLFIGIGAGNLFASHPVFENDTLSNILQIGQSHLQERVLVDYLKSYFQSAPVNQLLSGKAKADSLLDIEGTSNKEAYKYFIASMCQLRLNQFEDAENSIQKAIAEENIYPDHFLLFTFFTQWGDVRTERGNSIGAVYSYWRAKQEAIELNDYYSQAVLDINISDLYYKSGAYNQSLFYLNHSLSAIADHKLKDTRLKTLIYYNKAENFFRMNNRDSLEVYDLKLKSPDNVTYKIQTFRIRTDYYLQLLDHNYKDAIQLINSMQGGSNLYLYSELDKQHLAYAYYMNGQTDSAKLVIDELLKKPLESDNPEIKSNLYEMLAEIAQKNNDYKGAAYNNQLALKQSQEYISRLTHINNMAAQMTMDEMENSYIKQTNGYKEEQLILVFILIIAAFSIIMIYMFYRNAKQKRHYEKLLYLSEKNELSFINSHEVRKHLSNILGMIDVIHQSDRKEKEFLESQEYLYYSAEKLDEAIKNIAEKLNGD